MNSSSVIMVSAVDVAVPLRDQGDHGSGSLRNREIGSTGNSEFTLASSRRVFFSVSTTCFRSWSALFCSSQSQLGMSIIFLPTIPFMTMKHELSVLEKKVGSL